MIEKKFMGEAMKRMKAKEYLGKRLERAGIIDVNIQRTTLATRIILKVQKPGLVIGRKGKNIQALTEELENELGIENPKIEVAEVRNPNLEAKLIAIKIARLLERGHKPKRIMKREAYSIMRAGAIGCEIQISGTWKKGGRGRTVKILRGYIKKAGDATKLVNSAFSKATLKQGAMGIKVNIVPPNVVFPDKVKIEKPKEKVVIEEKEILEKPTGKKIFVKDEKKVVKKEELKVEKKEEVKKDKPKEETKKVVKKKTTKKVVKKKEEKPKKETKKVTKEVKKDEGKKEKEGS